MTERTPKGELLSTTPRFIHVGVEDLMQRGVNVETRLNVDHVSLIVHNLQDGTASYVLSNGIRMKTMCPFDEFVRLVGAGPSQAEPGGEVDASQL